MDRDWWTNELNEMNPAGGSSRLQIPRRRIRRPCMQISPRCGDVRMPERLLHKRDRSISVKGVGRVGVSEPMGTDSLRDAGPSGC